MAEYYVERQGWTHWPETLIMCRKIGREPGNGNWIIDRRRYVPERTAKIEWHDVLWGRQAPHCGGCGADLGCDTRNRQNFCPRCGARLEVQQ